MTSRVYLLDANVLIALATPDHSLHYRAAAWFRKGHRFSTCPITQGALIRFHLRTGSGATISSAKQLIGAICALPNHEFWPDDASYTELPTRGIIGHRQVTDAYLALLAAKHGGTLVTMDEGLAGLHRDVLLIDAPGPVQ